MEGSKIKNIVLLILLAVNVFLLVQVADQEHKSARYQEENRAGAVEVLSRQNIALSMEELPGERSLPPLEINTRDKAGEAAMAAALLGETGGGAEQGGPAAYRSGAGEGLFFSNGRFSFTFTAGIPLEGKEPGRHAVECMKAAGYEARVQSVEALEDGGVRVHLRQLFAGEEIFNYGAALTYRDGRLWSIEGQRLAGTPAEADGAAQGLSVSTVLIRFLGGVREGIYLCSEIQDLRLGYSASTDAGGTGKLTPVWLVVTNAGDFFVDGIDGTFSPAE